VFVAGGFMVILLFGVMLFTSRLAGGGSPLVAAGIALLAVLGGWTIARILQRLFLYRQRAAMLLFFSGRSGGAAGLAPSIEESKRLVPDHSRWALLNRSLRSALFDFMRGNGYSPAPPAAQRPGGWSRILDLPASGPLSQAILALAYARGMDDGRSVREALALYFAHGTESRRLARQWLLFSAAGQLFLFLCLAVPNWFFFRSAGAPVWIGIILAAAISRLLHQAFIAPLVLAGLSAALLAETRGCIPDPGSCEKLAALFPDAALAGKP
jgi:hypothetical protein